MNTICKKIGKAPRWSDEDSLQLRQLMDSGEVGFDDKPSDVMQKYPAFRKFGMSVFRAHFSSLKRDSSGEIPFITNIEVLMICFIHFKR